jgi:hypothetical protein
MEFPMNFNAKAYDEIKRLVKLGEEINSTEKAKEHGVHQRTIQKYAERAKKELGIAIERRVGKTDRRKPKAFKGGTLEDFRSNFDDSVVIPGVIERGIKKYLTGGDGAPLYMRDQDFREVCNVGPGKWRRYADDYKHLQVKKDGVIYWGHPEIIDEMRKAVNR